ncbi:uncharacterized protein LOC110447357 isoform X2 [Mizuhopecten yessoensis]|uniref:Uncharacterized protein n=1 Tax=Mizuhopecten yessoensis TaxID=6573 RepID=A0A210QVK5_MIZYE|nr:uncharacterized protein LOC110447357 isoform X2 [Mizuhopecten yessoensis]OWF52754.1 hypothetical protein KP79_PYT23236 [Mizuhopecten yessoensis]
MALSADTIKKYVTLDNKIHELELKNSRKAYEQLENHLKNLKGEQTTQKAQFELKSKATAKEKSDVDNLSKTMEQTVLDKGKDGYEKAMNKEEAEYLEALASQDMVKKNLDKTEQAIKEIEAKLPAAKAEVDVLDKLCKEQEEVLNSIFKGSYGSALENRLEADLDMMQEKKQRIDVARYKWTNGRVLLQHAVNQLAAATTCWSDLKKVPTGDSQRRYHEATKARNNLIAAIQNIQSTQKYLDNITFPYCDQKEIVTLEKAMNNMYTDMMTPDRYQHAEACYTTTQKRCAALLQWFDAVINTTILKDLNDANAKAAEAEKHLRAERMRLLKVLADEQNIAFDMDEAVQKKGEAQGMQEPDVKPAGELQQENTPSPPMKNIADKMPSQDEIFGNMEELKKVHDQRISEYQKVEEMNKARMDQGLQEKLAERRQRRMKQTAS